MVVLHDTAVRNVVICIWETTCCQICGGLLYMHLHTLPFLFEEHIVTNGHTTADSLFGAAAKYHLSLLAP